MRSSISPKTGLAALVLLACAATTEAHTWAEQLRLIASNGSFVGAPGYPRGFFPRTAGDPNAAMVYELNGPAVPASAPMCKATQKIGMYTTGFPMLKAAPGDNIAMLYEENGHVTLTNDALPDNTPPQPTRPSGNGTIFVYGTKQPSDDDTFSGIHKVWNAEGTGGNKHGKLLATRTFDDGQCYQGVGGADKPRAINIARKAKSPQINELLCQTDIQLPTDAGTSGTYALYWVWEFPALNNQTGAIITNETYTACMDVGMVSNPVPAAGAFIDNQPVESKAIAAHLKSAFLVNPSAAPVLQGSEAPVGQQPTAGPASGNPAPSVAPSPSSQPATGNSASSVASANVPATPPAQTPPYSSVPPQQPSSAPNPQAPSTVTVTVTVHDGGSGSSAGAPAATPKPTTLATSAAPQAGTNPASMSSASAPAPSNSPSVVFVAPSSLSPAPFNIGSQAATPAASAPAALQRRRAL